jgi:hypothetical protein
MVKSFTALVISLCLVSGPFFLCFSADEQLTITTYYPSPYGVYASLHADKMSIGSSATYRSASITDGLIVQGAVAIQRTSAGTYGGYATMLDVNGTIAASDVWLKNKSVWVGSLKWCTKRSYTANSGTTVCPSGTYQWFQAFNLSTLNGAPTYTLPTSGDFLCCS